MGVVERFAMTGNPIFGMRVFIGGGCDLDIPTERTLHPGCIQSAVCPPDDSGV